MLAEGQTRALSAIASPVPASVVAEAWATQRLSHECMEPTTLPRLPSRKTGSHHADAITLLMAFFVLMFSMSELKQERFAEFQSAMDAALGNKKALGLPTPCSAETEDREVFVGMADNMEGRLHHLAQRGEVRLATTRKGSMSMSTHFYEPGGFTIRPQMERSSTRLWASCDPSSSVLTHCRSSVTPMTVQSTHR